MSDTARRLHRMSKEPEGDAVCSPRDAARHFGVSLRGDRKRHTFESRLIALATVIAFCTMLATAQQRLITTVAGTDWFFSAEGKPGTALPLSTQLRNVAVDAQGNVYVPDPLNFLVFKIGTDGVTHVVAGNGIQGFSGDGGAATNASLGYPVAIAIDGGGNLYISDQGNYRIRRVTPAGIISTFAGTGRNTFSGDGGPASLASFGTMTCLGFDRSNNLLICDQGSQRVRQISPAGIVSTLAGNGQAGYSGDGGPAISASLNFPQGVAFDALGRIYIADSNNSVIRIVAGNGTISTFAGNGKFGFSGDGGPALSATLGAPEGVAIDPLGNIYISDTSTDRIRKIDASGLISTVAGNGTQGYAGDGGAPLQAEFFNPEGLAWDAVGGRLLLADRGNGRIRAITLGTSVATIAGNGLFRPTPDGTPATQAFLFGPNGVVLDSLGDIFIADTSNFVVRKVTPDGLVHTVAGIGVNGDGPDGGLAAHTAINTPHGLAIAPNGNLAITEQVGARISQVNANGIISTLAGTTAKQGFSGDGGLATQAQLDNPYSIAFDSSGNLYIADAGNYRVRKVSNNIITTFAGNGIAQSSGDGQAATAASLNYPTGVAVDSAGNVYIAEQFGYRIRKVTPSGIISTYAGTGVYGSTGDGFPATRAQIGNANEMTFDSQGNLYFAESYPSHKIRRIDPNGIISTVAGDGQQGFSGDGGPPTAATLNVPTAVAIGPDGTIYIADTGNNRIRALITASPSFAISASQLSFSTTSTGGAPPSQNIAIGASLQGSAFTGLPFAVTVATTSGGGWLSATPSNGTMPSVIVVSVDPATLNPGTYQGVIQINSPAANPPQALVSISLVVASANPPKISVDTTQLAFLTQTGANPSFRALTVSNSGGGVLNVTVTAATATGGNWLTIAPGAGTATAGSPLSLTVAASPGSLSPGTYSGSIVVASGTSQLTVPVTMSVSTAQAAILLSQTGLTFTAVAQGGVPLPQSLGILNTGRGQMNWGATASTLSGGPGWLSITPASGTVVTPNLDVSSLTASVNAAGLSPGNYYGQIQVTAAGAGNSPQTVSIVLNVLPPGSNPGPEVQPTGLIFVGPAGSSLGSQTVMISNPTSNPVSFSSSSSTVPAGGNWLTYLPYSATVSPNQPVSLVMQADLTNLSPGVQRGLAAFLFGDGSVRTVSILTVVAPNGSAPMTAQAEGSQATSGCKATTLLIQPTALTDSSSTVTLLQPAPLRVRVVDDCGNPFTTSQGVVSATFSNGDSQVSLTDVGQGNWSGTWTPRNTATRVTLTFLAIEVQGITAIGGSSSVSVSIQSGSAAPLAFGVSNAASGVGTYIAPGGLVSIYGVQLADQTGQPGNLPLPTQLNGTQVLIGNQPLPLRYVGAGQVNAQVPFDLPVNTALQLVVQRGVTLSVPQQVVVAAAQPGIYTQDQSGSGPGVIVDGTNLVSASAPAKAGDTVVIYCNGLGAVTPAVSTGTAAPLVGPLSNTINPVAVTIGGVRATVNFAGLTPGFPDLYQVNVVVPSGVTSGLAVPVVLTVAGQTSPAVTMAIQ